MSERARLMIMDDDPGFAAATRMLLEDAGYAVEVAYNPRDGLAALRARAHDLLLLDLLMGRGAEGAWVARAVRADPALRHLRILLVTGIQEQLAPIFGGDAARVNEIPHDGLLEKPVTPESLLAQVAALLQPAARGEPR